MDKKTQNLAKFLDMIDKFLDIIGKCFHCVKYARKRFSLTRMLSYKGRIYDYVLIRKSAGQ